MEIGKEREADSRILVSPHAMAVTGKTFQRSALWCKKNAGVLGKAFVLCWLLYVAFWLTNMYSVLNQSLKSSNQHAASLFGGAIPVSENSQKHYINIGMRQDYLLQECQGTELKQSFPDIDYSLMGYNIFRGYPLAIGHDPGFTYPIFVADYKSGKQTADCRYSIPRGLVVVPDVSCVTSFTSKVVHTQYEFAESLSVSASVSGGGWGAKFSASAGYKESSSEISTGESVFIISSASCNYYFSKLIMRSLPPLDPVFLSWIKRLSSSNSVETYIEFLETYGTHFPTEVTYGARFTYEHKMESKKYETLTEKGTNIAASASYSGAASVGASFSMDTSQREKASEFSKSVDTKTIAVGAPPPANGDALTWASTVKNSPVPSKYTLSSIEELFSDKYLNAAELNIDLSHIVKNINHAKHVYCKTLLTRGETESCQPLTQGLILPNTLLSKPMRTLVSTYKECVDHCVKYRDCVAFDYCVSCSDSSLWYHSCLMYGTNVEITGRHDEDWKTMIFPDKLKSKLVLLRTQIKGNEREVVVDDVSKISVQQCESLCMDDAHCIAYSYCKCDDVDKKCKLYSFENIEGFTSDVNANTIFVVKKKY